MAASLFTNTTRIGVMLPAGGPMRTSSYNWWHLEVDAQLMVADALVGVIRGEVQTRRPGGLAVLARASEALFIEVLRRQGEHHECARGRLRGLADPQVSQAIGLIHRMPGEPWTVASLGRAASLSRSAFAEHFTRVVGESPLGYLTSWRMTMAARMLTESEASMADIATRVGYQSEAAFAKAFARVTGTPPGAHRRNAPRRVLSA